jgi:hypothetical protein
MDAVVGHEPCCVILLFDAGNGEGIEIPPYNYLGTRSREWLELGHIRGSKF